VLTLGLDSCSTPPMLVLDTYIDWSAMTNRKRVVLPKTQLG
jgi:hypothetical protein